jgi:predicted ArsR family transcriptional regulator
MARAIEESARRGVPVIQALQSAAAELGRSLGDQMRLRMERGRSRQRLLDAASETLTDYGYEPSQEGNTLQLVNCPFHLLAQDHTDLVCGMNVALLAGAADQVGDDKLTVRLDPSPGRCCVVVTAA